MSIYRRIFAIYVSIILAVKIGESCIPGLFPKNELNAVSVLNGSFGLSTIQGTVNFYQDVKFHVYF
jgi:hypothetical protein